MGIKLVVPTIEYEEKALDFKQEFFDHHEKVINGSELLDNMTSYKEWLKSVTDNAHPDTVCDE